MGEDGCIPEPSLSRLFMSLTVSPELWDIFLREKNRFMGCRWVASGKSKHKHVFVYYQRPDVINDANELVDAKGMADLRANVRQVSRQVFGKKHDEILLRPFGWEFALPVEFWNILELNSGCPALVLFDTGDAKLMITTGEHEDVRIKNRAVPRLVVWGK